MKKVIYLLTAFIAFSCSSKEKESVPLKEGVVVDTIQEVSEDVEIVEDEPQLIVTPEHWENFSTDISAIVFFTEKDDLPEQDAELVNSIEGHVAIPNTEYYQVYSSDSVSYVYLNDTLMFDFTEYKHQFGDGYFLLKPGEMPFAFGFEDDVDMIAESINTYYK